VETWVREAEAAGAKVVAGGKRSGALFEATLVKDATDEMKVVCEEVFGPVMAVLPFDQLDEVVERVNRSRYGLQAGVFTESLEIALYLARRLEVGGVNINDTSNFRADPMPFGGVKESGIGREGPRYAVEEMTDLRTVTINLRRL